ncbi:hypothetical protein AB0I84_09995 [Streptomyces spectabilis]
MRLHVAGALAKGGGGSLPTWLLVVVLVIVAALGLYMYGITRKRKGR